MRRSSTTASDWLTVGVLAVAAVLMVAPLYGTIPLVPEISQTYAIATGMAGLIGFAYGIAYATSCLFFGPLSDVLGRRTILIGGLVAAVIFNILAAHCSSLTLLLCDRVAQGIAAGTFGPVALGYIAETYEGSFEQAAFAMISTGLIAAGSIAQIGSQLIAARSGWRSFFVADGAIEAGIVLVLVMLLRDASIDRSSRSLIRTYAAERALMKTPAIIAAYLVGFVLFFCFVFYYTALGPYIIAMPGAAGSEFAIRAAAAPGMLLTVVAGGLIVRFSARHMVSAGLVVAIAGLAISAASAGDVLLLSIGSAVFSLGFAYGAVSLNALIAELGGTVRGTALAFAVFLAFTGASVAPIVYDASAHAGFAFLTAALAVAMIAASICITAHVSTAL